MWLLVVPSPSPQSFLVCHTSHRRTCPSHPDPTAHSSHPITTLRPAQRPRACRHHMFATDFVGGVTTRQQYQRCQRRNFVIVFVIRAIVGTAVGVPGNTTDTTTITRRWQHHHLRHHRRSHHCPPAGAVATTGSGAGRRTAAMRPAPWRPCAGGVCGEGRGGGVCPCVASPHDTCAHARGWRPGQCSPGRRWPDRLRLPHDSGVACPHCRHTPSGRAHTCVCVRVRRALRNP